MKTNSHRLSLLVALVAFAAATAFAHPGGHGPAPAKPPVAAEALPATMADTLSAIQNQTMLLKAAQKDGKFAAVSAHAATLNQLVQHIVAQVPAEHRNSLKEIADKHATTTAELIRAAAAGATNSVANLVAKLSGNLSALQPFAQ